jgi:hypothetical protein
MELPAYEDNLPIKLRQGAELDSILNKVLPRLFSSYTTKKTTPKGEWMIVVKGDLRLDNPHCDYRFSRTAQITMMFLPYKLTRCLPMVWVHELWMKQEIDWHCRDNRICWELDNYWTDLLKEKEKTLSFEDLLIFAMTWCLESSASLIGRHWYAHTNKITEWPKEWDFWGHGETGKNEYEQSKQH